MLRDADWQTRYARDASGGSIPFALIEREIQQTQPFAAQGVRNLMVVCYAEKALYETPDDRLTPDGVLETFRAVERDLLMLPHGCPRPTLAVPHLLARESSAYYHGYVLAQMAVHQTRAHFFEKLGHLVDNPAVGRELAESYWRPGNSRPFLDFVRDLTGRPFSADALAAEAGRSADEVVERARAQIDHLASVPEPSGDPELDLRLRIIHGQETVAEETRRPLEAAEAFRRWVRARWPRESAGASA
jgi:hypothetical protein